MRRIVDAIEVQLGTTLLIASLLLTCYGVGARYLFSAPLSWTDEPIIWLVVWSVFLSASRNVRDNEHISVDFFVHLLPPRIYLIVTFVTALLGVLYSVLLTYFGVLVCQQLLTSGLLTSTLRLPMWLLQSVVPLAGAMLTMRWLERLYLILRQPSRILAQRLVIEEVV